MGTPLPWEYDDGGRAAAGFRGGTRDCAVRSIVIAAEEDYRVVYDEMNYLAKQMAVSARGKRKQRLLRSSSRTGHDRDVIREYLARRGWTWVPIMGIGTGTEAGTVHLAKGELPEHGRLIVSCSRHITAVINGTVHDNHDPTREGTRLAYGYWQPPA